MTRAGLRLANSSCPGTISWRVQMSSAGEPWNSKEVMRRSHTTRHEILGNAALFSFSVTVSDEIYRHGYSTSRAF